MAFVCDNCRKTFRTVPRRTATGRTLDDRCYDELMGAAAGMIAGQSPGAATATGVMFGRLKEKPPEPKSAEPCGGRTSIFSRRRRSNA